MLFLKPDYWVIVDDVIADLKVSTTTAVHEIDLAFQFAPMEVSVVRDRWARAITPSGNTFWVGTFASAATKAHVKVGDLAPIRGWVSTDYGQRMPAPPLVFSAKTALPWRSITLLMPQRGDRASVPAVSALFDDHNLPIGVELEGLRQSVFVDDGDIFRSMDL